MNLRPYPGDRVIAKRKVMIFFMMLLLVLVFSLHKGITGLLIKNVEENSEIKEIAVVCKKDFGIERISCKINEDCEFISMKEFCESKKMKISITEERTAYCNDESLCVIERLK
jgi:hypothetical protein